MELFDIDTILKGKIFGIAINPNNPDLKKNIANKIEKMGGAIQANFSKSVVDYIIIDPNDIYINNTQWKQSGHGAMEFDKCLWIMPEFLDKIIEVGCVISRPILNNYIIDNIVDLYNNHNSCKEKEYNKRKRKRKTVFESKSNSRPKLLSPIGDIITIKTRYKNTEYTHSINMNDCNSVYKLYHTLMNPWKGHNGPTSSTQVSIIPQMFLGSTLYS